MIRCLILLENAIERLSPQTSMVELANHFWPKLLTEKLSPNHLLKSIINYLSELVNLTINLPMKMDSVLQLMTEGELKVVLEHHYFDNSFPD